tara:strand:+ start:2183 stop:3346 length:1164 start_codon:yes stop_codon:yes gene_type:complete
MRVLVVTRYFWPEDGVAEEPLMLKHYANWHINKGHSVEVVTGAQAGHINQWNKEFDGNLTIEHFLTKVDRESSFLKRIINSIMLLLLSCKTIIFKKKFDLIYVFSGPPLISLFINILNKLLIKRSKIVFIIQDNVVYRISNNFFKKLFKTYIKLTIILSDVVLVLSRPMKDEVLSYFKQKKAHKISSKIMILLNFCADLEETLFKAYANKSIDIIYAGNHGSSQGLTKFIDVISCMNENQRPKISFYGEGTEKKNIIKHAKQLGVSIQFNDPLPRKDIKINISKAKFGLVCMSKSLSKYAFPSKLATYLSVGTKAIICSNGFDHLNNFIKNNDFGYFLDSSDLESAAIKLKHILANEEEIDSKLFQRVEKEFGGDKYFQKLGGILDI